MRGTPPANTFIYATVKNLAVSPILVVPAKTLLRMDFHWPSTGSPFGFCLGGSETAEVNMHIQICYWSASTPLESGPDNNPGDVDLTAPRRKGRRMLPFCVFPSPRGPS
jgi:hypothetical protein